MSTEQLQVAVVDCGNKFELLAQLADIGREKPRHTPFRLTIEHARSKANLMRPQEIKVFVNGLAAEDGSGNRWLFNGTVDATSYDHHWVHQLFRDSHTFHGYIDVRTRTGHIFAGARQ